ncbi:MAG: hypothetical protein AAF495_05345 [Pseudomonadota bacterium]
MPKWLEKELLPGETTLASFGANHKGAFWLAVLAFIALIVVCTLVAPAFGDGYLASMVDQIPIAALPFIGVGFLSKCAITQKRVLGRTSLFFSGITESLEHPAIEALELKHGHLRHKITVSVRDGTALQINGVRHPADFLDAMLSAYSYRDLVVRGVPAPLLVCLLSPILLWTRVLIAVVATYGLGAIGWDLLVGSPDLSLALRVVLFPLIVLIPLLISLGILLLLQGLFAVTLHRWMSPDDLCRTLIHFEPPKGHGKLDRIARWNLNLTLGLFSWLYGRPMSLWTPPSTTVSSKPQGGMLRHDAKVD